MSDYIVKLSGGCRHDGRTVDGEYSGGKTIAAARKEAAEFAGYTSGGQIHIVRPIRGGDSIRYVETIRDALPGHMNTHAGY